MKKFPTHKLGSIGYISESDMRPYETPDNAISDVLNMRVENGSIEVAKGWKLQNVLESLLPEYAAVGMIDTDPFDRRVQIIDIKVDINEDSGLPPTAQQPASTTSAIHSLDFSPNGNLLAAVHTKGGGITVWNTTSWEKEDVPALLADADGEIAKPFSGRFNHDGTKFIVGYGDASVPVTGEWVERYTVVPGGTWTKDDLTGTAFAPGGVASLRDFAFSADGNYIAVGDPTGTPEFFVFSTSDYLTEETLASPTTYASGVHGVDFSNDGNYVVFTTLEHDSGSRVHVYNVVPGGTWTKVSTGITSPGVQHYRCHFSPNSQYLAVTTGNSPEGDGLYVYNTSDWSAVSLTAPGQRCEECAWSSDGKYLVVCSFEASKHLWVYDAENSFAKTEPTDYQADQWYAVALN